MVGSNKIEGNPDGLKKIKRIRITVETERLLVTNGHRRAVEGWCNECGEVVTLMSPEEAAVLTGTDAQTIHRQVSINLLHCAERSDGARLICLNSLLR